MAAATADPYEAAMGSLGVRRGPAPAQRTAEKEAFDPLPACTADAFALRSSA